MHISEIKGKLRNDIKERIDRMSEAERHAEGRTISRLLLEEIPKGSTVCAFFPLKTEIDIRLFLQEFLKRGDTLFLPVFDQRGLRFKKTVDLTALEKGQLGIPEPRETDEELTDQDVDIVIVPGRAFDAHGNRLGRGSGGYDKWLKNYKLHHPQTQFWGVGLECQIVPQVPVDHFDVKLDRVMTSRGWIN